MVKQVPADHFCRGCGWARFEDGAVFCPFIEGSCARFPETLVEPDLERVRTRPPINAPEPVIDLTQRERPQDYPMRFTFGGETKTIAEWSEFYGVLLSTLRFRMSMGWNIGAALERGREESYKRRSQNSVDNGKNRDED